jgi:transcriptional regulator with XRE-family HTH domain
LDLAHSQKFSRRVVAKLKDRRLSSGLSQRQVAELSGLSRSTITMIESGERNPTVVVCHALAVALNVPLSKVIRDAEKQ